MLILAVLLILAWKVAGWYGLDRWVLTFLGTRQQRIDQIEPSGLAQPAGD